MWWVQSILLSLILCVTVSAANYATNYDGVDGTVTVGNSTAINPAGPFTVEAWVKPAALGSQQDIVYKWSGGGYPDQRSYFLQVYTDGRAVFSISKTGDLSTLPFTVFSDQTVPTSQWTEVAGVYDGSALSLFVNGVKQSQSASVSGSVFAGNATLRIGGTGSTFEPFDGAIDEVRISDVARYTQSFSPSPSEFAPDANTLVLLHMNEGVGTTTANAGTQGANGMLNSGVSWTGGVPEPSGLLLSVGTLSIGVFRRTGKAPKGLSTVLANRTLQQLFISVASRPS